MPLRLTLFALLAFAACGVVRGEVDYLREVKPLLEHKCYSCHAALKQNSQLRVDTAASLRKGGETGPAVTPGQPDESLLIQVVTGDAGFLMPPEGEGSKLSEKEVALLRRWIAEGATGPENEAPQQDPRRHWSYAPPRRPSPPHVDDEAWSANPIDAFITARRAEAGLGHRPEAPRLIWLRRVHLDLLGLPPTEAEQKAFLNDDSAAAYERVVDDLLARPQYGERWGRHWMDIWRYSDWYGSRGINEIRYSQRHIWRWRDWIVRSLNDDKGYDQMLIEMLAADEVAADDPDVLAATGYLGRNWYKFDRNVWMFESVERTGEAFLGLTLRCCRCHDHKYDPISQEEYYRFRAFFEPHNVRTDRIAASTKTSKDATLGQVLNDGVARVFDKDPDAPTYRFIRGDNRYPDKSKKLSPGTPAALGGSLPEIKPVELPPGGYYPALRPAMRQSHIEQATRAIPLAEKAVADAKSAADQLAAALAARIEKKGASESKAAIEFITENFDKPQKDVWQIVNGDWKYENGVLTQKTVTSFATLATKKNHPQNFRLHLKYRPLQPGTYRSIGFSFDYADKGNSQDVYTSTGDAKQSVQAFHRTGGKQVYPREGIVPTKLKVGELATLDVVVQGSELTIDLNGERKLDYPLPIERKEGKFALWVHAGAAEFHELKIEALKETLDDVRRKHADALLALQLRKLDLEAARADVESVKSRIAADVAAHFGDSAGQTKRLAREANRAEQQVKIIRMQQQVLQAENRSRQLQSGSGKEQTARAKAIADAKKKLEATKEKLAKAEADLESSSETYTPIGAVLEKTSTGRRLALARWIADKRNPRTARVAANHIWGRHFGSPLVATTENFGLNGAAPTHPQLLDWLASELVANDWRMKPLHRRIVLSRTYRMLSSPGDNAALEKDPNNRFYWRMNSRRMEAELVRDAVLHLAERLDLTRGGPEIPEADGEKVLRRSIYFRNTPNEKMQMLEVFDVADPNSCYRRKESVVPHQSLALMNSGVVQDSARVLAAMMSGKAESDGDLADAAFIDRAFLRVLCRPPTESERKRCALFLAEHPKLLAKEAVGGVFAAGGTSQRAPASAPAMRARENLVQVLLLHNDFVTVR